MRPPRLPGPPPGAPAAPPVPAQPPAPIRDPAAVKIIDEMVAAYAKLDSLSAKIEFTVKQGDAVRQSVSETLVYARPDRVKLTATNATAGASRSAVLVGGTIYATNSAKKGEYSKGAAPAADQAITATLSRAHAGFPVLGFLLTGGDAAKQVVPGQASLAVGPDAKRGGVDVSAVVATMGGDSPDAPRLTFFIGKEDRLLRAIEISSTTQQGQKQVAAETYSDVQKDPKLPADAFTFTPEAGAKEVAFADPNQRFDPRLKVGADPLPFAGKDLDGKDLTLADYKGKVVLLDFWATWCGPCIGELPNVLAAYEKYKAQGFDIVGVSLDRENYGDKLRAFLTEKKMPWRQIYDGKYWDAALAQAYGIQSIPFTLLIGRDGKIAAVNPRGATLAPAIEKALAVPSAPTAAKGGE